MERLCGSRWTVLIAACLVLVAAPATAQKQTVLAGTGSNVPVRLYSAWLDSFNEKSPDVKVHYLPVGTEESIEMVTKGSGDFGGGEVPLSQKDKSSNAVLLQIPTVLVGMVPVYNLPGHPDVNFSGEVLAQIYLGTIKNWNDPRIAKLNPGAHLPDMAIHVVHRSGGKGSNYIFTEFLADSSPDFRAQVGKSSSPKWPVGKDANRGEDMVQMVESQTGSIGYVELNFAEHSNLGYGKVQNHSGNFVKATPASITAACASVKGSMSKDFRVSLVNASGKDAYPLASFTWLYVPVSRSDVERSRALKEFLTWTLQDGQAIAQNMGYAILPADIRTKAEEAVKSLQ